jgi:hypothetical protein
VSGVEIRELTTEQALTRCRALLVSDLQPPEKLREAAADLYRRSGNVSKWRGAEGVEWVATLREVADALTARATDTEET